MKKEKFKENSHAVQSHLTITQSVIQRMSTNSASCKAWCIALVSAILVVVAQQNKPQYALVALIPIALFGILDSYYLVLEKRFRNSYNNFIDKLHKGEIIASDLYAVKPAGDSFDVWMEAVCSFSIWFFYLALVIMTLIAKSIIF